MNKVLQRFSPREWTLVGATLLIGIVVPTYLLILLPQWRQLGHVQMEVELLENEYVELQENLRVRDQVDHLYAQSRIESLDPTRSDHIITSDLLREIDAIRANYPSVVVGNIRPLPVESETSEESSPRQRGGSDRNTGRGRNGSSTPSTNSGGGRLYPVRMTVSGKLPEIIDFITTLTHRRTLIRLDSFTLRGIQGVNQVECKFEIRMVGFPRPPGIRIGG